jgi:hypothetical protein
MQPLWMLSKQRLACAAQARSPDDAATRARALNARVLSGRLHSAVRNLTNRGGGGVLTADDVCTKTGRPVMEVL